MFSTVRTLTATRYVTPLREGGSLPAIVEAEDDGLYVMKFRGAGQGEKALIAELVSGEIARALGLPVPELVLLELEAAIGRAEPHDEIRDLLNASVGLNLGLDYLPGSVTFDPAVGPPLDAKQASEVVWFDALVTNVDRTARNPNLLVWHRALWLIDHGASLYFHHSAGDVVAASKSPFAPIRSHVLLPWATELEAADARLRSALTRDRLEAISAMIPDAWLKDGAAPDEQRATYVRFLERRLEASSVFVEEALRARAQLV
jgi:hypothetical protein